MYSIHCRKRKKWLELLNVHFFLYPLYRLFGKVCMKLANELKLVERVCFLNRLFFFF